MAPTKTPKPANPRIADVKAYVAKVVQFLDIVDDPTLPMYEKRQLASELRTDGAKLTGGGQTERRMVGRVT